MKIDHIQLHEQLLLITEEQLGITREQLCSNTRKGYITRIRQMHMGILRQYTKAPLSTIAHLYGGRDHATALHAIKLHHDRINPKNDPVYYSEYNLLLPHVDHYIASVSTGEVHYLNLNVSNLPISTLEKLADLLLFEDQPTMSERVMDFAKIKAEQARMLASLELVN